MSDHPPGYEAEQPVDLSKPVAPQLARAGEPAKPGHRPPPADVPAKPPRPPAPSTGTLLPPEAVRRVVTVANIRPRTFKSTVARMLYTGLESRHANVRLWNGVGTTACDGLVVADMPADPYGADWRRQSWNADLLVLPIPDDLEAATAAWWMLDQLEAEGRQDLVLAAIVVAIQTGAQRMLARTIVRNFTARTAGVVRVKLPKGIARADDHARWEPLVSTVSMAVRRPAPASRAAPRRPAAQSQVVQLDSRRQGRAANR
ncbi:hypothetical protein [Amycolatopsis thailandensis]|uniref:hypothetical protein n=1 Tax=Amycolatopsis thailandensis TaxID=589330 RepID=UPI00363EB4B6